MLRKYRMVLFAASALSGCMTPGTSEPPGLGPIDSGGSEVDSVIPDLSKGVVLDDGTGYHQPGLDELIDLIAVAKAQCDPERYDRYRKQLADGAAKERADLVKHGEDPKADPRMAKMDAALKAYPPMLAACGSKGQSTESGDGALTPSVRSQLPPGGKIKAEEDNPINRIMDRAKPASDELYRLVTSGCPDPNRAREDLATLERAAADLRRLEKAATELGKNKDYSTVDPNDAAHFASLLERAVRDYGKDVAKCEENQRLRRNYEKLSWSGFPKLTIGGSVGQVHLPQAGIGFQRMGAYGEAPERFAFWTPKRLTTYGLGGSFDVGSHFRVSFGYDHGKSTDGFSIDPDSGIDSGIVYGGLSPSGSSGIISPFGLSGDVSTKYDHWFADATYRWVHQPAVDLAFYGRFSHDSTGFRESAWGSGELYGNQYDLAQTRDQSIHEDRYEAGASVTLRYRPMNLVVPYARFFAGAYYRSTKMQSREHDTSNFGPSEDQDFTLESSQTDHSFAFHGGGELGLEFKVSPKVSLMAGASAEYWSKVGQLVNPYSGDQVYYDGITTHLGDTDMSAWKGFAGVKVRY